MNPTTPERAPQRLSASQGDVPTLGGLIKALHRSRLDTSNARRQRDNWAIAFIVLLFLNAFGLASWLIVYIFL